MTGSASLVADAQGQRGGHLGGKEEARCQFPTFSCGVILTLSKEDTGQKRWGPRRRMLMGFSLRLRGVEEGFSTVSLGVRA